MMARMFEHSLGKTMEVYIDDMLMKLASRANHLSQLREAFKLMRQHRLRLNPDKCVFRVVLGKFLGYLMSRCGIEVLPEQASSVLQMKPPETKKQINALIGKLIALKGLSQDSRIGSDPSSKC